MPSVGAEAEAEATRESRGVYEENRLLASLPVKSNLSAKNGEHIEEKAARMQPALDLAEELLQKHPKPPGRGTPGSLQLSILALEKIGYTHKLKTKITTAHERDCAYWIAHPGEWRPPLERWISDGDWLLDERQAPKKTPAKQVVSQERLEAMQKRLDAHTAAVNGRRAGA